MSFSNRASPGIELRRGSRCEDGIAHFHPPLEGEGRAPQVRGVGCAAAQGVAARVRAHSPQPATLRVATFPLQGKVICAVAVAGGRMKRRS